MSCEQIKPEKAKPYMEELERNIEKKVIIIYVENGEEKKSQGVIKKVFPFVSVIIADDNNEETSCAFFGFDYAIYKIITTNAITLYENNFINKDYSANIKLGPAYQSKEETASCQCANRIAELFFGKENCDECRMQKKL